MPQNAGGRGRDYRESDVQILFARGREWTTWGEPVQWLRTYGNRDAELRSADARALLERDFARLDADGVPFTRDPGKAYRLGHEHRRGDGLESGTVRQRPTIR